MTLRNTSRTAALATLIGLAVLPGLSASPKVGQAAPEFKAETVDGKKIALSDYKGKSAVLLNFYANF